MNRKLISILVFAAILASANLAKAGDVKLVQITSCSPDRALCLKVTAEKGSVSRLRPQLSVYPNATIELVRDGNVARWTSPRVQLDLSINQLIVDPNGQQSRESIFNLTNLEMSKVAI